MPAGRLCRIDGVILTGRRARLHLTVYPLNCLKIGLEFLNGRLLSPEELEMIRREIEGFDDPPADVLAAKAADRKGNDGPFPG
jgi:hypothetical protein